MYNTAQDGRLGFVGLWRQYRNASLVISLFLSCFILSIQQSHSYFRPQQFSSFAHAKQLRNREIARRAFLYWRHSPTIPSIPFCAVLYPTGSEIRHFYMSKTRGSKSDKEFFCRFSYENCIKITSSKQRKFCHIHFKKNYTFLGQNVSSKGTDSLRLRRSKYVVKNWEKRSASILVKPTKARIFGE